MIKKIRALINFVRRHPYISLAVIAFINSFFWAMKTYGVLLWGDDGQYNGLAINILKYHTFGFEPGVPTMEREPLFSIFIALIYYFFGYKFFAVFLSQMVIFSFTAVIIYKISRMFFDEDKSLAVGFMAALFPSLASFTGLLYTEVFFTFLLVLFAWFFLAAAKKENILLFFAAGIFYGLATLTRSVFLYVLPMAILFFVFYFRKKLKKAAAFLFIFIFAVAISIAPWVARNKARFNNFGLANRGGLVLYTRSLSLSLSREGWAEYAGTAVFGDYITMKLLPKYSGDYRWITYMPSIYRSADLADNLKYDQDAADKAMFAEAKMNILAHPFLYLAGVPVELFKLNSPMNPDFWIMHIFVETHKNWPALMKILIILAIRSVYWIFFAVVIYGLYRAIKSGGLEIFLAFLVIGYNGLYSLLDTIPRYGLPMFPLYFVLFVYGFSLLWPRILKLKRRKICAELPVSQETAMNNR